MEWRARIIMKEESQETEKREGVGSIIAFKLDPGGTPRIVERFTSHTDALALLAFADVVISERIREISLNVRKTACQQP